jgi:hypothetical protein
VVSRTLPVGRHLAASCLLVLVTAAGCGSLTQDQPRVGADSADGAATLAQVAAPAPDRVVLHASLSGAQQVSGGHATGSGTALLTLVPERSEVCFTITVSGIGAPTGAHLHNGRLGQAGRVVLNLAPPAEDGSVESCAAADSILVQELASDPQAFYVGVHTASFPQGAIRGQLRA